jgi:hypothetical protein
MAKAGVGYTENPDSKKAGEEAAKAALAELGSNTPDVVMLWHTAKHNPHQFHSGVRQVVGPKARIVGGYAAGCITKDKLGYEGYQGSVGALSLGSIKLDMFIEQDLRKDGEKAVGKRLAQAIKSKDYSGSPNIVYMYDTIKNFRPDGGFDMNIGTYFIDGMTEGLVTWPSAAGCGMIGNMQFNPTYQYFDDRVEQQAAWAAVFHGGGVRMDTVIMHGCKPASDYHTITKADGNVILEIDGKPALDMIAEMLGTSSGKAWKDYPLFVTLGVNRGDKYGEYKEEDYANRLCMAIDENKKALIMFEPDLVTGTEVQLMRRSMDFKYIGERAEKLYKSLDGRKAFFALYIDCAGRMGAFCGSQEEEASEVQKVIGSKIPLLGVYTGVEIGDVGKQTQQPLDWSGVLCVFSEPA